METIIPSQAIRYQLQECLGQGLNSRVYRALRQDSAAQISHEVAIKILNSKNWVEIWKKEFQSLSSVRSKHCVSVLGFDWIDEQPALVLELIDGLSLEQLKHCGKLTGPDWREIFAQAHQGLKDLEQAGLSHGDLSLSNIMVSGEGRVVLLDFGLANFSERCLQTTVEFAHPQLLAGGASNLGTDLYALRKLAEHLKFKTGEHFGFSRLAARKRLAEKIVQAQAELHEKRQITERIENTPAHVNFQRFGKVAALALLFTCSLGLRGEVAPTPASAYLTVRTAKWVRIDIEGHSLGYAPFERRTIPAGKTTLKYQTHSGTSSKTLTIYKGQHVVLDDRFFATP